MAIIQVENLSLSYLNKTILKNISLNIEKNKITSLIGASGCGKTTFLHCLNNLIKEVENVNINGDIKLEGYSIYKMPDEILRKKIGLVFQVPTPFPISIYKNIEYPLRYYGLKDKKIIDQKINEYLKMVGLYDEVKDNLKQNAMKLSGGQKQRLCLARALSVNPQILLLDEPCSSLDSKSTSIIEETLLTLKHKYTIIIVTHNMMQAKRISDNVIFMGEDFFVETSNSNDFFKNKTSLFEL